MTDHNSAALNRSRAVDLIVRTLDFADWSRASADELERVAVRLLEQIEQVLTATGQPSDDLAADIAYGGGRSENIQVPARRNQLGAIAPGATYEGVGERTTPRSDGPDSHAPHEHVFRCQDCGEIRA